MAKLKFIFIIFLLLCETAYSNPCEFTAKVTPEKQTERVKAVYKDTCTWFISVFDAVPSPDIPLDKVTFIQSWSSVKYLKDVDTERLDGSSHGVLFSSEKKTVNEIFILENTQSDFWNITTFWLDSLLAHEFVHYLTKSSRWNSLSQVKRMNISILESHAYWSQDQYIQNHSEGRLTLINFIIHKDEMYPINSFVEYSVHLRRRSMSRYIYNAILWFDTDPKRKFDGIVNGSYILPPY